MRGPWSLVAMVRLLVLALGCTAVLVAAVAAVGRARVRDSTTDLRMRIIPAQAAAADLTTAYVDQETGQRGYVLTGDRDFLTPYLQGQRDATSARTRLGQLLDDPLSRARLAAVDAAGDRWRQLVAEPEIQARTPGPVDPHRQVALAREGKQLFDALRTRLDAVEARVSMLGTAKLHSIARDQQVATALVVPLVLSAVLVAVLATLLLRRRLADPARRLVDDVSAVARGDYERAVSSTGPAEFVDLAAAVEAMRVSTLRYGDELAESRHRLARRAEQDRLSADLHDLIVQRVFAVGLQLESAAQRHPDLASSLHPLVADTDEIIRELRGVIFDLRRSDTDAGLAGEIEDVVEECARALPFTPALRVVGALDAVPLETVGRDVLACVRELLSNVARHAGATSAAVTVTAVDGMLTLRVADNGVGMAADHHRGDGTRNLAQRAAGRGGSVRVEGGPGAGTTVTWSVPYP